MLTNLMSVINRPILKIHHESDGEQSEYKHDQFAIIITLDARCIIVMGWQLGCVFNWQSNIVSTFQFLFFSPDQKIQKIRFKTMSK